MLINADSRRYGVTDPLHEYLAAIAAGCPDLQVSQIIDLHVGGQFNRVLLVNDTLIFRFPHIPQAIAGLRGQASLLRYLQPLLPLPIPKITYACLDPRAGQRAFIAYPRLAGDPLYRDVLDQIEGAADLDSMALQLGEFLRTLHEIAAPPDLDVPTADDEASWARMLADFEAALFPHMRPAARESVTASFQQFLSDFDQHPFRPALRHGDFGGSNILFDRHSRRISGIIDFDSLARGDPAIDAAALLSYGEAFFDRACRAYPELEGMKLRTEFYRSTFALQEALYGVWNDDPESFEAGIADYR
jgi:aminoglycoside 2''-phosphotransferase